MTINTGLIREMAPPVAFRTQVLDVAADQEKSIRRSMRFVTGQTPFNLLGEMLIDPRPFLFGMAFKTGLVFGIDARPPEAGPLAGPVGAMAVRALQSPLEDLVGVGQIELRFHIQMAGETEVNFVRLQFLIYRSSVNLMAIITSHCA